MSHSSGNARGQVEPLAAIVAVFAVCVGLTVYAGALDSALAVSDDRDRSVHAADVVERNLSTLGVVVPRRLTDVLAVAPAGYRMNVSLTVGDRRWSVGRPSPANWDATTRRVTVRTAPARNRPGRLRVVIWP